MAKTRGVLNVQVGSAIEVLSEDNRLMLRGRVISYANDVVTLQGLQGQDLPTAVNDRTVRIRLPQNGEGALFQGKICGSTKKLWRIDRLQKVSESEMRAPVPAKREATSTKREFFRQSVRIKANVQCLKRSALAPRQSRGVIQTQCSVLDVSANGIMILSSEPFQIGDRLLVSDVHIGTEPPFRFTCTVRRVARTNQFGCQFDSMEQKEEDRLLRALFTLQRQELQKRRNQ